MKIQSQGKSFRRFGGAQDQRVAQRSTRSLTKPLTAVCSRGVAWLATLLMAISFVFASGCAWWPEEEEKPRTVTEWMKLPRVGEDLR